MRKRYNILIEKGEDGYLISSVLELPGCHTQAKNYDALIKRTEEAIALYLSARKNFKPRQRFLSLQQLEI